MSALRIGLFCTATLASAVQALAQDARSFRDSWYWGAKAGTVNVGTSVSPSATRPTFGAEWLITRTLGGLYVSADYADFDLRGTVADPSGPGGRRSVDFSNMRRVGFAALAFPRTFGPLRPYAGVGASLNVLGRARAVQDSAGGPIEASVNQRIEDGRTRATVLGMAGVQAQLARLAIFAQLTMMPGSNRFLLDDRALQIFEAGLRFNFGSSIDRGGRGR